MSRVYTMPLDFTGEIYGDIGLQLQQRHVPFILHYSRRYAMATCAYLTPNKGSLEWPRHMIKVPGDIDCYICYHYIDVTRAFQRFKSPVTPPFLRQIVQGGIREDIKAPLYWPFVR